MTEIYIITAGITFMIAIYVISPKFINRWSDKLVDIMMLDDAFDFIGLLFFALVTYATLKFSFLLALGAIYDGFKAEEYAISLLFSALFLTGLTLGLIFLVTSIKKLIKVTASLKK